MPAKNLSEWRKFVLERDNYTCQVCRNPGNIADHKVSIMRNPLLMLESDNGQALCRKCHGKYGDRYIKTKSGNNSASSINRVGGERNTYTITIPKYIIRAICQIKNLDIAMFRKIYHAVIYYNSAFDGAFIRFEETAMQDD